MARSETSLPEEVGGRFSYFGSGKAEVDEEEEEECNGIDDSEEVRSSHTVRYRVGSGVSVKPCSSRDASTVAHLTSAIAESSQSVLDYLELSLSLFSADFHVEMDGADDADDELPFDFRGGYVGYLGYEVRADTRQYVTAGTLSGTEAPPPEVEGGGGRTGRRPVDGPPDAALIFADRTVVYDHIKGDYYAVGVVVGDGDSAVKQRKGLDKWMVKISGVLSGVLKLQSDESTGQATFTTSTASRAPINFVPTRTKSQYLNDVALLRSLITDGETYEACCTNALVLDDPVVDVPKPIDVYRELRKSNASPFGGYFIVDDGKLAVGGKLADDDDEKNDQLPSSSSSSVAIVCSSPEEFLRIAPFSDVSLANSPPKNPHRLLSVQSKPIKGTLRRRGPAHDDADAESLRTDPKSRSENLMIADLVRNDFGRVCLPGTVDCVSMLETGEDVALLNSKSSKLCVVEKYATLLQLVTTVSGLVDPEIYTDSYPSPPSAKPYATMPFQRTQLGIVRSTFPPGSMTGAPKIRTMDILERFVEVDREVDSKVDSELEDVSSRVLNTETIDGTKATPRGPYSGSLGYFGLGNGASHLNVIIRTAVMTPSSSFPGNTKISIGCGGAIVKDSDPMGEYEEMRAKGSVVVSAVERAINKNVSGQENYG